MQRDGTCFVVSLGQTDGTGPAAACLLLCVPADAAVAAAAAAVAAATSAGGQLLTKEELVGLLQECRCTLARWRVRSAPAVACEQARPCMG